MRITQVLSHLLAAMALMTMALGFAPSVAGAHVGHGSVAVPAMQAPAHAVPQEVAVVEARERLPVSPVRPCTTDCCAAGMGCCAALHAAPDEIGVPHAHRLGRGCLIIRRAGIEPDVPLKPPRSAIGARNTSA